MAGPEGTLRFVDSGRSGPPLFPMDVPEAGWRTRAPNRPSGSENLDATFRRDAGSPTVYDSERRNFEVPVPVTEHDGAPSQEAVANCREKSQ